MHRQPIMNMQTHTRDTHARHTHATHSAHENTRAVYKHTCPSLPHLIGYSNTRTLGSLYYRLGCVAWLRQHVPAPRGTRHGTAPRTAPGTAPPAQHHRHSTTRRAFARFRPALLAAVLCGRCYSRGDAMRTCARSPCCRGTRRARRSRARRGRCAP